LLIRKKAQVLTFVEDGNAKGSMNESTKELEQEVGALKLLWLHRLKSLFALPHIKGQ
jgi:hypothetical protein